MNGEEMHVRLSGEKANDAAAVGEVLTALDGLFREVSREMCGDPDAVTLKVGSFRLVCDGCEREYTEQSGWTKHKGLDYCPTCQRPDWRPSR